ncbi:MAG TPA: hypothetical protein VHE53_01035 [Patescibacteria group bacterium]|nr:hypothetical protein [Patescibacteria group bacterium]
MDNDKRVFSEIIKKQMAILGPDITLAKVKNVPGITVDQNGEVTAISGNPQELLQQLINQFVELSGLIVKKTMESILMSSPNGVALVGQINGVPAQTQPQPQVSPVAAPNPTPAPEMPMHKDTDNNILSANKDLEDLNKMLNTISK